MQKDLNVQCYTGLHLWLIVFIGGPGLALFVLGVPIGIAVFLRLKHQQLETDRFSQRYGFLYEGETGDQKAAAPLQSEPTQGTAGIPLIHPEGITHQSWGRHTGGWFKDSPLVSYSIQITSARTMLGNL